MTVDGKLVSTSQTQEQEPIYQGAEYKRYRYKIENGTAYYKSDTFATGDVVYYNRSYKKVPLVYDQVSDELVTVDISGRAMIRLFTPKINSFHIHGADFIYFTDTSNAEMQGFWEVLVNSNTKLLKREIKVFEKRIINSQIVHVIQPHLYYRIFKNGDYHEVQDKKQILEIFADKKDQVQGFLRANRRQFRKAGFQEMLRAIVIYYNEISARK